MRCAGSGEKPIPRLGRKRLNWLSILDIKRDNNKKQTIDKITFLYKLHFLIQIPHYKSGELKLTENGCFLNYQFAPWFKFH